MTIEANDIFDILLLSYILYRILLVLKGTRAYQSLVGLFVLLILYVSAQYFELFSIVWLLDKFFVYFVLAIIILFQEDILKGLAKAGSLFPSIRKEKTPFFEEINKVCFLLAKRRIGALIAIEKTASLGDMIESATQLDALISQDLLRAIFLPHSPLHDGAVIVVGNVIVASRVTLPVSKNKKINKSLGLRHKAGIGVTEESDAVSVVISEETGKLSYIKDGKIVNCKNDEEFRNLLSTDLVE